MSLDPHELIEAIQAESDHKAIGYELPDGRTCVGVVCSNWMECMSGIIAAYGDTIGASVMFSTHQLRGHGHATYVIYWPDVTWPYIPTSLLHALGLVPDDSE